MVLFRKRIFGDDIKDLKLSRNWTITYITYLVPILGRFIVALRCSIFQMHHAALRVFLPFFFPSWNKHSFYVIVYSNNKFCAALQDISYVMLFNIYNGITIKMFWTLKHLEKKKESRKRKEKKKNKYKMCAYEIKVNSI